MLKQQTLPAFPGRKLHRLFRKNKRILNVSSCNALFKIEKILEREASHLNVTLYKHSTKTAHASRLEDSFFDFHLLWWMKQRRSFIVSLESAKKMWLLVSRSRLGIVILLYEM